MVAPPPAGNLGGLYGWAASTPRLATGTWDGLGCVEAGGPSETPAAGPRSGPRGPRHSWNPSSSSPSYRSRWQGRKVGVIQKKNQKNQDQTTQWQWRLPACQYDIGKPHYGLRSTFTATRRVSHGGSPMPVQCSNGQKLAQKIGVFHGLTNPGGRSAPGPWCGEGVAVDDGPGLGSHSEAGLAEEWAQGRHGSTAWWRSWWSGF